MRKRERERGRRRERPFAGGAIGRETIDGCFLSTEGLLLTSCNARDSSREINDASFSIEEKKTKS
jgi:hypothetical protein